MNGKKDLVPLITKTREQIETSLRLLELSYERTKSLKKDPTTLADEELGSWEAMLSRFARSVDLFVSKYVRLRALHEEPGFRGSTRDFLNLAEKIGLIQSGAKWLEIKELRNRQAHDYEDEDLAGLFVAIQREVPFVLSLRKTLESDAPFNQ